jgi:O-antigen biosynthesis protein
MSVSAIVVTFNSEKYISNCLKTLSEEISSIGGDIIVHDNDSSDATIRIIESTFPDAKLYRSTKNIGFAAACNEAVESATGEYLLFANPDMLLDKGALNILLESIKSLPDAGVATARMRFPDGSFQPTCRQLPTYRNIFFSRGSVLGRNKESSNNYTLGDSDKVIAVPAAAATCLLISRELFQKIGGFDKRFFMFMEDTDLSLRIGQAGQKIYFVPQAGAVHYWGEGAKVSTIKRRWYHHLAVWKYFIKHYPNGISVFVLPLALLFNLILTILTGLKKDSKGKI